MYPQVPLGAPGGWLRVIGRLAQGCANLELSHLGNEGLSAGRRGKLFAAQTHRDCPRLPPPTASGVGKLFRDPHDTQAAVTMGLGTFLTLFASVREPARRPFSFGS